MGDLDWAKLACPNKKYAGCQQKVQPFFVCLRQNETHIQCPYVDIYFQFRGILFSWDSEKAAANFAKHGLSFERACEVFLDPLMQLWDASAPDEERSAAVGSTFDREVLYVVHVEREGDLVRMISARVATRPEKERYEDNG